jgi:hypothetical protein
MQERLIDLIKTYQTVPRPDCICPWKHEQQTLGLESSCSQVFLVDYQNAGGGMTGLISAFQNLHLRCPMGLIKSTSAVLLTGVGTAISGTVFAEVYNPTGMSWNRFGGDCCDKGCCHGNNESGGQGGDGVGMRPKSYPPI